MERNSAVVFVATGGAIADHAHGPYRRFRQRVKRSDLRHRFLLLGWLDRPELNGLYQKAHIGINLDRPCAESTLGSRNRLLDWAAHGLPAITTAHSELARDLVQRHAAWPAPTGADDAPNALARAVARLLDDPDQIASYGRRAQRHVARRYSLHATTEPLIRWADDPGPIHRPPPPATFDPTDAAEKNRLAAELAAIRQSRVFRVVAAAQDLRGNLVRWWRRRGR